MPRRRAGLADLVQVRHEAQHRLALAAQVHQRLAAAQRSLGRAQKAQDQRLRFGRVDRAVGLLLGPAGAGHEQQLGVRTNGLLVGLRRLHAGDRGARGAAASTATASTAAVPGGPLQGATQPGSSSTIQGRSDARQHAFHALPVEPARDRGRAVVRRQAGGVRIHAAAQPVGHARQRARPSRGGRRDHDRRARRAAERFGGGGIGGVARLGERLAASPPGTARPRSRRSGSRPAATAAPTSPTVSSPPSASAAARASRAGLASVPSGSVWASSRYGFHVIPPRIQATISRAISSAGMFFTMRVCPLLFGQAHRSEAQPGAGHRRRPWRVAAPA